MSAEDFIRGRESMNKREAFMSDEWTARGGQHKYLVAMRLGDTPVPIPNTTVKTKTAENTMLETAWEDRWVPDPSKRKQPGRVLK